jgi:peptidoglycan/xylan/chitin deacetylase (PgdA/CDA1 family)
MLHAALGHGWQAECLERLGALWGPEAVARARREGLAAFSKSADSGRRFETEVLAPIYAAHGSSPDELAAGSGRYLGWSDYAVLARGPLVELGSHGHDHRNWALLSREEIADDISRAHRTIAERSGTAPRLLAAPFGEPNRHVLESMMSVDIIAGYEAVLWVSNHAFRCRACRFPLQLPRHHAINRRMFAILCLGSPVVDLQDKLRP